MNDFPPDDYEGWATVSLFGHISYTGWVSRAYLGGQPVLKVTAPEGGFQPPVRYVTAGALYSLTPRTEGCQPPSLPRDPFDDEDDDELLPPDEDHA